VVGNEAPYGKLTAVVILKFDAPLKLPEPVTSPVRAIVLEVANLVAVVAVAALPSNGPLKLPFVY